MIVCPESFIRLPWSESKSREGWKAAIRYAGELMDRRRPLRCIALVGLPGSGKSTWARENDSPTVLIFDSTGLTKAARRSFLQACSRSGIACDAVVFDTPVAECIARQALRTKVVPTPQIRRMATEYEPPSLDEGYRRIVRC